VSFSIKPLTSAKAAVAASDVAIMTRELVKTIVLTFEATAVFRCGICMIYLPFSTNNKTNGPLIALYKIRAFLSRFVTSPEEIV
jgi:hypothetical protein